MQVKSKRGFTREQAKAFVNYLKPYLAIDDSKQKLPHDFALNVWAKDFHGMGFAKTKDGYVLSDEPVEGTYLLESGFFFKQGQGMIMSGWKAKDLEDEFYRSVKKEFGM